MFVVVASTIATANTAAAVAAVVELFNSTPPDVL